MKRFYKEFIFALFALFTLNLIIYFTIIYPEVYKPYERVVEDVKHHNLIFADSHGWSLTNNNPEGHRLLDNHNISNLSYGSDSYVDILFKLKYLIENDYRIDTIYLSIDPHMFGKKRIRNNNKYRSITYSEYDLYSNSFETNKIDFLFRKYIRKYISAFDTKNSKLMQKYLESKINKTTDSISIEWDNLDEDTKNAKSVLKFNEFYSAGPSKKLISVYNKILQICYVRDIEVILMKYPLAPSLENMDIPDEFKDLFEDLNLGRHNIIEIKGLKDHYFENQDHVNKKGARVIITELFYKRSLT